MQYFKSIGGMLSYQFEQDNEKDDNKQSIKAIEQPMTEEEFITYKEKELSALINKSTQKTKINGNHKII
jgi:hypothetical protein